VSLARNYCIQITDPLLQNPKYTLSYIEQTAHPLTLVNKRLA